jgi:hypothetical protein
MVALLMAGVGVLWAYLDTSNVVQQHHNTTTTTLLYTTAGPIYLSHNNITSSTALLYNNNTTGPIYLLNGTTISGQLFSTTAAPYISDVSAAPLLPPSPQSPHPLLFGGVIFVGAWISMMVSTVNGASTPIIVSLLHYC